MPKLVAFSRRRPRPAINVSLVREEYDKTIVVVVPTGNVRGFNAQSVAKIFAPLPIIFVESFGPFFNYSTSINKGIDTAINLGADWIILSNDDMIQIDSSRKLINEICSCSDYDYLLALPEKDNAWTHSFLVEFSERKFHKELISNLSWAFFNRSFNLTLKELSLRRRYDINLGQNIFSDFEISSQVDIFRRFYYTLLKSTYSGSRVVKKFRNFADFGIFRKDSLVSHKMDTTFINGYEDSDLMLRLISKSSRGKMINYRIGHKYGNSLSENRNKKIIREAKEILNRAYFCYKVRESLYQ